MFVGALGTVAGGWACRRARVWLAHTVCVFKLNDLILVVGGLILQLLARHHAFQ